MRRETTCCLGSKEKKGRKECDERKMNVAAFSADSLSLVKMMKLDLL